MKHPIVTGDGVLRMHKSSLTTRDLKSFSTASRLQRTSGEQMIERSILREHRQRCINKLQGGSGVQIAYMSEFIP